VKDKNIHLGRLWTVIVLCVGFQFFIIVRLCELQIFRSSQFRSQVKKQSETTVKLIPPRGRIYDRHGRLLATTIGKKRVYPLGKVAGTLLGFVGKDGVGLEGVEYEFDSLLSGRPGWMTLGKTPMGYLYPYPSYPYQEPEPAKDIVLTIDANVQSIIEDALEKRVKELYAKSGSGIAVCPTTGEILAMVTVPSVDPNHWRRNKKWRNIAFQDEFEPGSTFKIVPLSVIVDKKLVNFTDIVEDGSCKITINGKTIHDVRPHPPLTFEEAVWRSSNVAFIKLSRLIGKKSFYKQAILFGFSTPTGIRLPAEARGHLSFPSTWKPVRFANLAFGQGVTATLLQLAFAYQAVANNGTLLKPLIIKEVRSRKGRVLYRSTSFVIRKVLSPSTAQKIKGLLCGVIENGSGMLAKVEGIKMAGKTGTANKCVGGRYVESYISTFICFFPVDKPIFLIACMIDDPKKIYLGGEVLGPVIKEIVEKLMKLNPYAKIYET
jgi:cell division protein FtsI/penicillin-binding protein 2